MRAISDQQVEARDNARPNEQADPENDIAQQFPLLQQLRPAKTDKRHLHQLHGEKIAPDLLEKTSHD